jgi:hypothetical protein
MHPFSHFEQLAARDGESTTQYANLLAAFANQGMKMADGNAPVITRHTNRTPREYQLIQYSHAQIANRSTGRAVYLPSHASLLHPSVQSVENDISVLHKKIGEYDLKTSLATNEDVPQHAATILDGGAITTNILRNFVPQN